LALTELMPGLWLSPVAIKARRTVMGYTVTVIPTERLLDAEQLSAICQASGADVPMVRRRLASPIVGSRASGKCRRACLD
jgi:hypothetical protein